MKLLRPLFLAASALAISACTVGPDHARPATPTSASATFIGADHPAFALAEPAADWWRLYEDPVLDQLVQDAFAHNTDLRVATANLARARALLREARAGRLPQSAAGAGATYGRAPESQVPAGADRQDWQFDAGLDVSWELDLFGRVSREIEAGRADAAAAAAARDATRVAVAAETARA